MLALLQLETSSEVASGSISGAPEQEGAYQGTSSEALTYYFTSSLKPPLVAGTTDLCFTAEEMEASLEKAKELAQNTQLEGCGVTS